MMNHRAPYFLWKLLLVICLQGYGQSVYGQCPRQIRQYANVQATTGSVTSASLAADQLPATASTLNAVILSTTRQWLGFGERIAAGTPVYLKLSTLSGTLGVGAGFSVQGYVNGPGATKIPVAPALSDASLLGLLNGNGELEITLTPGSDYDGVLVTVTGGISVGFSMKVFEAYILKSTASPIACNQAIDVLKGAHSGLNLLTLGNVTNEWDAVDADLSTAAHMNLGLGLTGTVYETVVFSTASTPGDSISIMLSRDGAPLLDLTLLGTFSIQPYLGSTAVGSPITSASTGLSLRLLTAGGPVGILTAAVAGSFDRVEIRLNAIAGVALNLNLFDVTRIARKPTVAYTLNGAGGPSPVCITLVGGIGFSVTGPEACDTYRWYNGSTFLGTGNSISPVITTAGDYVFYVEAQRSGCTNTETRASFPLTVTPKAGPPSLTIQNNP